MNWQAGITVGGILFVQTVVGIGALLHATREYDAQIARIDVLYDKLADIKQTVTRVEENTKILDLVIERQNNNTRAIERLNDVVHPPTP